MPWATKDVLTDLLTEVKQHWMQPCTTLHRIIRSFFAILTDTADIERLMSVFSLDDNVLNQA